MSTGMIIRFMATDIGISGCCLLKIKDWKLFPIMRIHYTLYNVVKNVYIYLYDPCRMETLFTKHSELNFYNLTLYMQGITNTHTGLYANCYISKGYQY